MEALLAVERGGYASDLLASRLKGLDPRDAGLASEIVLGSLRVQAQLDFLIARYAQRPIARMDPMVVVALRMGVYQLRYLDRVPAHAAVSESVEMVNRGPNRSASGLVNAVLRRVNRDPVVWPDRATELSVPAWMLARWDRLFGPETATAIAQEALKPPMRYVRVPAGQAPDPEKCRPTSVAGCFEWTSGETPPYRQQDIGSQAIVPLLELAPGMTFLDMCAAPGNKTAQALESRVRAVACDKHMERLKPLRSLEIPLVLADCSKALPFGKLFDRILIDAPCSGTGTLGRNPEIRWRLRQESIDGLQRLQRSLLRSGLDLLKPGGLLVYSTCSLEAEENEQVVGFVAPRHVRHSVRRTPGKEPGDGFFAAVLTSTPVRRL